MARQPKERQVSFKLRKGIALCLLIFSVNLISATASAAVSNGTICSRINAVTKSNGITYRCVKNPFVSPKRNTWTQIRCVNSIKLWRDAKSQYESWRELAAIAGPEGLKAIEELQINIVELEVFMKDTVCKKGA